jgi:WD40 repeat protein
MARSVRFAFLVLAILLTACSADAVSLPTRVSIPSSTPTLTLVPSVTPSPTVASTLAPTATFTPTSLPLPVGPVTLETPVPQPVKEIGLSNIKSLSELARWGKGRVQQLEYSPDGQWLVVKTAQGSYVYPAQDLTTSTYFEGMLYFAPNSQIAAAVTGVGQVEVWQVAGWKRLTGLAGVQVAFSPDSALLAIPGPEGVHLIKTASGELLHKMVHLKANRALFNQDGTALVTSNRDSVRIWQMSDGKLLKTLDYERVLRVMLTSNGSLLLVQGRTHQNDSVIDIYYTSDWTPAATIAVSSPFVLQPDGSQLFVYSNFPTPGRIEVFSLPKGLPVREMRAGGSVYRIVASPDNQTLVASIVDYSPSNQQTLGYLKTFDVGGKELKRLECGIVCDPQEPVFSPDGKLLAVKGVSSANSLYVGTTFLFNPRTGERIRTLRGPKTVAGNIEQVTFTPNGQTLTTFTGRADDAVRLWKVADGTLLNTLEWGADTLNLGDLATDGKLLAAYSDAGVTWVRNVGSGALVKQIQKAIEARFSPRADWLVVSEPVSGRAESLRLVRSSDGETVTNFPKTMSGPLALSAEQDLAASFHNFSVQLIKLPSGGFAGTLNATGKPNVKLTLGAFSPDGKLLAGGSVNGEVWLWHVAENKAPQILEGHKINVTSVVFSRDGKLLLTGSSDGMVYIWDASNGHPLKVIQTNDQVRRSVEIDEGSFGQLAALAVSPDNKLIAVSGYLNPLQPAPSRAGVIALISAESGDLLRVLPGGGGNVAFSLDGKVLFTSGDGAIHQWGVLP